MRGLVITLAALVAAGGSAGAYYYFEVYKKKAPLDASGANTATIKPVTTPASFVPEAAATPAAAPAAVPTTTPSPAAAPATGTSSTAIPITPVLQNQPLRFLAGAGKYLDCDGGRCFSGNKVQAWDGSGAAGQQWTMNPDGTVTSGGFCLDVDNSGTANGTSVRAWDCNGTGAQKWQWRNDGSDPKLGWTLQNPQSGKCLDLPGGNSANGTKTWLWDCNNGYAQRWLPVPFGNDTVPQVIVIVSLPSIISPVPVQGVMRLTSLLFVVLALLGVHAADWQNGRATNYGPTDQFKTEWSTGTCKCWGPDSYRAKVPCFDEINNPSHIAAVDTGGMRYTGTCGTCLLITCVDGPTRGLPYSTFPYGGCRPGAPAVMVQVTDSCPCEQNESNDRWCCQDTKRGVRHIDMATPAFASIAHEEVGVVDILFQQVPCPASGSGSGVVWDSWEQEFDTTIESWSQNQNVDTLATVESACAGAESAGFDSILEEDRAAAAENRTVSDLVIAPEFARGGVPFDEVYNSTIY